MSGSKHTSGPQGVEAGLPAPQMEVLADVMVERERQSAKWGEQNHDPITWGSILTEEVGEFSEAALHLRFGGPKAEGLRAEAIQVAAVAIQFVECLDRGKWSWPPTVEEKTELLKALKSAAKTAHYRGKLACYGSFEDCSTPSCINWKNVIAKAEGKEQP